MRIRGVIDLGNVGWMLVRAGLALGTVFAVAVFLVLMGAILGFVALATIWPLVEEMFT